MRHSAVLLIAAAGCCCSPTYSSFGPSIRCYRCGARPAGMAEPGNVREKVWTFRESGAEVAGPSTSPTAHAPLPHRGRSTCKTPASRRAIAKDFKSAPGADRSLRIAPTACKPLFPGYRSALAYVYFEEEPDAARRPLRTLTTPGESPPTSPSCRSCCASRRR